MRAWIAVIILIASAGMSFAQQQKRPTNPPRDLWCRDMQIAEASSVQYCMAYTLEQCLASRGAPSERCYLNPIYDPRFRR